MVPMRRNKQALPQDEIERILTENTSGVLSVLDGDGYPYGVPLSYVYTGNAVYFHSATAGHKLDAIRRYAKATFCVIDADDVHPCEYTTYYKSVIAFGNVTVVDDPAEATDAILALCEKYYPDHRAEADAEIQRFVGKFLILKLSVVHLTGKQSKELL